MKNVSLYITNPIRKASVHKLAAPFVLSVLIVFVLAACKPVMPDASRANTIAVDTTEFDSAECSEQFIAHPLDHTTVANVANIGLYESNGSGLAINDLDGDGDLDIVLGNLGAESTLLWNEGNLKFRTERLPVTRARAVNIVDADGDGRQDIVFTRRFDKPLWLQNTGNGGANRFVAQQLPDVNNPFYTMDWADLDQDGDLDFVAASYDTELSKQQGAIFDYRGGGVGVFIYLREGDGYSTVRLAQEADALALALTDLNSDGLTDILVGNDFIRPDYAWVQNGSEWEAVEPFASMSENTMSFDVGDVNNDGTADIFATDMKPMSNDAQTEAIWGPLMAMMAHELPEGDPQAPENVLQLQDASGTWQEKAQASGIDATGWSWSSKFGDLNGDGLLDIYVVNGMIATDMLAHLPNGELVEENVVLRNAGADGFITEPQWGLNSTASGRGMSMADLDGDGDLDVVVNNLASPAQLFENQLCDSNNLLVTLHQANSQNPFALGAELLLHTQEGVYQRTVRAASGYLSGDPAQVHFGLPQDAIVEQLEIVWPGGETSLVSPVSAQTQLTITRQ